MNKNLTIKSSIQFLIYKLQNRLLNGIDTNV